MEFKYYAYCLADVVLIASSLIYGVRFLRKRNILLGIEWLVVTFSASNLLINALTGIDTFLGISLFCDAFSRTAGIPVIAIAGLMAVTHGYKASTFVDVVLCSLATVATVIVWTADFMVEIKPYFYLVMWSIFSVYLAYFVKKLLDAGEKLHAVSVMLALIFTQTIATTYDFYHIPGDDDHMIFYIFALLAWSYQGVSLYYAYCALERAQEKDAGRNQGYAFGGLEQRL